MLLSGKQRDGATATLIEDVFSTYVYDGNGTTQDIVNGIDLATDGGMVWFKCRSFALSHYLFDTERGVLQSLTSNDTNGENTRVGSVTSFNTDGVSIGSYGNINDGSNSFVSHTFRKAPRFFDQVKYTGNGVAGREIAHDLGCEVGMIIVKRTNVAGFGWATYHRSNGNTGYLSLNTTDGFGASATMWNNTSPTSTEFTIGTSSLVNTDGGEYIAYLFAHDPLGASGDGSDSLIQCGSYVGNGSADGPEIDLGWETQYLMTKPSSSTGNWYAYDSIRGLNASGAFDAELYPSTSGAEYAGRESIDIQSNGFKLATTNTENNANGVTYVYMAIRRGMKTPTSSDEVFAIDNVGQTVANYSISNFPVDMSYFELITGGNNAISARMQGVFELYTNTTGAETNNARVWDSMDGIYRGFSSTSYYEYMFKRAKGFFDVVAYTGDGIAGRTVDHNLGVVPEMMWVKRRDTVYAWYVYHANNTANPETDFLLLNESNATADNASVWNDTAPTDSVFSLGTGFAVNQSAGTYIAYLFCTLAGISKVDSYTGNGTSITIDAGFTTGAKFIIIKRTDVAGDWFMWDSVRGIVAGNDPHLSLNTTAAEVTTDDSIDPDTSGFIVNQVAATNVNVTSAEYIYYAVAT